VDTAVGEHTMAHLAGLQLERSLFKRLLHGATAELTEVTSVGGAATLRELCGDSVEVLHRLDLLLKVIDVLLGLFERARDWLLAVAIVGVPGADVLLEDVLAPNLPQYARAGD